MFTHHPEHGLGGLFQNGALVVELRNRSNQRDHDFRTDIDASSFRFDSRFEDCATLHFGDFWVSDTQSTAAMTEHRVRLAQRFDNPTKLFSSEPECAREQLAFFATVGEKFVK